MYQVPPTRDLLATHFTYKQTLKTYLSNRLTVIHRSIDFDRDIVADRHRDSVRDIHRDIDRDRDTHRDTHNDRTQAATTHRSHRVRYMLHSPRLTDTDTANNTLRLHLQ